MVNGGPCLALTREEKVVQAGVAVAGSHSPKQALQLLLARVVVSVFQIFPKGALFGEDWEKDDVASSCRSVDAKTGLHRCLL